jgi:hypothetical protein
MAMRCNKRGLVVASTLLLAISACGGGGGGGDSGGTTTGGGNGNRNEILTKGTVGCYAPAFANASAGALGCGLITSFGDPFFDQRFQQEIAIQSSFWQGVPATVYAFDECSPAQANAMALPQKLIFFGGWLVQQIIFETGSELPVAGVLAHEWGHQIQFQFGWMGQTEPTVRRTELEADMWSGYYMGLAKSWAGPQMNAYLQTLFNIGDFNFHDRNHHGTPNQRLAAGATGLDVAFRVATGGGVPLTYQELHAIFTREVSRILGVASQTDGMTKTESEPLLGYAAKAVLDGLDRPWIDGVLSGNRSLEEFSEFPSISESQKAMLRPISVP